MAISFSDALGIHEKALQVRVQRSEVLANNLANADTPGYKARDVDFRAVLASHSATSVSQPQLQTTNSRHIGGGVGEVAPQAQLLYRVPTQPSIDGNTVDEQAEMSRFAKNAMDFQASFQFLNSKFKGLNKALSGGK